MATTYLSRTFTTNHGTAYKYTYSVWVKRSKLGTTQDITSARYSGDYTAVIGFNSSDALFVYDYRTSYLMEKVTNRKFRDPSAWYHIVVENDNSVASPETKIYVNGVQETSFSTTNEYSQNDTNSFNNDYANYIGQAGNSSSYFNGCMSHFYFIDGTAYPASTFGSFDATSGIWKINTGPTVTMGTNGFTILKDGNTITDQSSNSNNFTLGAGTLTNTEDNPSNNFNTLNPLLKFNNTNSTLSNGNTTMVTPTASVGTTGTTVYVSKGKWYTETKIVVVGVNASLGVDGQTQETMRNSSLNQGSYSPTGYAYAHWGGKYHDGSSTDTGVTFTTGDIIQIALDLSAGADATGKIWFGKNNTWINSGDPANGTNEAFTVIAPSSTRDGAYSWWGSDNDSNGSTTLSFNFGNGYFGTTAVSSANADDAGIGAMEYDVPAGYYCLCTKNIKAYG
jgi:hypothetical protein